MIWRSSGIWRQRITDMPKIKHRSPNKQDVELGFKIRKLRQNQKLSLEHVAERIGISKQQLRKYELGRNKISARRLGQVATILGIKAGDLIEEDQVTEEKQCSDIDKEAKHLWNSIDNPEHKRTLLAMMRMVIKNNA